MITAMMSDRRIFVLLLNMAGMEKNHAAHAAGAMQPGFPDRIRPLPPKRQREETASVLLLETGLLILSGQLRPRKGRISLSDVAACAPIPYSLSFGSRGKPYFANIPDCFFSISHSGSYAACAFSGEEIGLDLQTTLRAENDRILRLSKRFFSSDDHQALLHADKKDLPEQFTKMWTAHEAYVKYTGEGLHVVRQFSTQDLIIVRDRKTVASYQFLPVPEGYCMALCGAGLSAADTPCLIQMNV